MTSSEPCVFWAGSSLSVFTCVVCLLEFHTDKTKIALTTSGKVTYPIYAIMSNLNPGCRRRLKSEGYRLFYFPPLSNMGREAVITYYSLGKTGKMRGATQQNCDANVRMPLHNYLSSITVLEWTQSFPSPVSYFYELFKCELVSAVWHVHRISRSCLRCFLSANDMVCMGAPDDRNRTKMVHVQKDVMKPGKYLNHLFQ